MGLGLNGATMTDCLDDGTCSAYGCAICGRTWVWRNTVEGERQADRTLRAHAEYHRWEEVEAELEYDQWARRYNDV